jgi:hypothetical protein
MLDIGIGIVLDIGIVMVAQTFIRMDHAPMDCDPRKKETISQIPNI